MKTTFSKLLPFAALGLFAGPAMATITWNAPGFETLFQDDSLDFALEVCDTCAGYDANDPSTWELVPDSNGNLDIGDVLVAVVEFDTAAGIDIGPNEELTGISIIEFDGIDGNGLLQFSSYQGGFNSVSPVDVTGGGVGEDAVIALWLDGTPELEIDAGFVPSNLSCDTFSECLDQASDGTLWQVDGLVAGEDNYWYATGTGTNLDDILTSSTANNFGSYSAGLTILENNTGFPLVTDGLLGTTAGNGKQAVDVLVSGNINGGGATTLAATAELQNLIDTGYVATDDADLSKIRGVPAPATLLLLGAGLLGLGFRTRRT